MPNIQPSTSSPPDTSSGSDQSTVANGLVNTLNNFTPCTSVNPSSSSSKVVATLSNKMSTLSTNVAGVANGPQKQTPRSTLPFNGDENVFVPTFGTFPDSSNPQTNCTAPLRYQTPAPTVPATQVVQFSPGDLEFSNHTAPLPNNGSMNGRKNNFKRSYSPPNKLVRYYCIPDLEKELPIPPTRHLMVSGINNGASPTTLKVFFEQYGELSALFVERLFTEGCVYVSFFDMQAAMKCQRELGRNLPVVFCVRTMLEDQEVQAFMKRLEDDLGGVYTLQSLPSRDSSTLFIEFCDIRDAAAALERFNNGIFMGCQLRVTQPQAQRCGWVKAGRMVEIHDDQNVCIVQAGSTQLVNDLKRSTPRTFSAFVSGKGGQEITPGRGQIRRVNADAFITPPRDGTLKTITNAQGQKIILSPYGRRDGRQNGLLFYDSDSPEDESRDINKNIIDIEKIMDGTDPRTTIMVRNIPNRLTQTNLKDWLDETAYRRYDFLYLRIDFANECNVGYAFVNFMNDSDFDSKYYRSQFGSEKVVEMAYANIQTRAKLIEKFRNSSVMDQPPDFRPLVFFPCGENAGLPMDFPSPNNLPRKLRSVTAAENSGLYNPRPRGDSNFITPQKYRHNNGNNFSPGYRNGNNGYRPRGLNFGNNQAAVTQNRQVGNGQQIVSNNAPTQINGQIGMLRELAIPNGMVTGIAAANNIGSNVIASQIPISTVAAGMNMPAQNQTVPANGSMTGGGPQNMMTSLAPNNPTGGVFIMNEGTPVTSPLATRILSTPSRTATAFRPNGAPAHTPTAHYGNKPQTPISNSAGFQPRGRPSNSSSEDETNGYAPSTPTPNPRGQSRFAKLFTTPESPLSPASLAYNGRIPPGFSGFGANRPADYTNQQRDATATPNLQEEMDMSIANIRNVFGKKLE
ncbi:hypothetical protein H072_325 [Dactylellina haptotyla CBS 200.50]|uniref:RRM domain-containing protein n=1 Tax=Dactylellina haptotyla (strain CBS 200.50) TaxID=1284197 RepID=S8CDB3_DACHA|nr:hypothetical protein H072_325 [Dactylellina haptotyla CBS 200.50]